MNGGRVPTGLEAVAWARRVVELGAGEIVLTSMDADGTKNGYDLPMLEAVCRAVNVPVVACGGGLVVQPGMLAKLQAKGVVVCLHASFATVLERTQRHRVRPLLEVENPEERIRTLYAAREPIYKQAGTVILTDARPLNDVVAHVIRAWRRDSADFARQ